MLNSQCSRRLTWSPKNADSTNQKQLPAYARAERDVFYARLQWQGKVNLYKRSIFVITHTIFHPTSSYVTTKLYETSACGCNNNTIFQKELFSRFPPSTYVAWQRRSLGDDAKVARWRHWWIQHFSCLKCRFCVLLPCQIFWLYCEVVEWYSMRLVCIAGYYLHFSFKHLWMDYI